MSSRQVEALSPGGHAVVPILSPQSGSTAAPVNAPGTPPPRSPHSRPRGLSSPSVLFSSQGRSIPRTLLAPVLHSSSRSETSPADAVLISPSYNSPPFLSISPPAGSSPSLSTSRLLLSPPAAMQMRSGSTRSRSRSRDAGSLSGSPASPLFRSRKGFLSASPKLGSMKRDSPRLRKYSDADSAASKAAQAENDSMVYLEGPCVYTCGQCRTHLTSHDDIISKSFHGRHGRAYLFDQCVNVTVGPAEDRLLITGLHSVCDIFCKRCKSMVGWTYAKAYESSQKYKEGKFIIEKINLYLEESHYDVNHPAGERGDRWRKRSMSWGSDRSMSSSPAPGDSAKIIFEYKPGATTASPYEYSPHTPRSRKLLERTLSAPPASQATPGSPGQVPAPPYL